MQKIFNFHQNWRQTFLQQVDVPFICVTSICIRLTRTFVSARQISTATTLAYSLASRQNRSGMKRIVFSVISGYIYKSLWTGLLPYKTTPSIFGRTCTGAFMQIPRQLREVYMNVQKNHHMQRLIHVLCIWRGKMSLHCTTCYIPCEWDSWEGTLNVQLHELRSV